MSVEDLLQLRDDIGRALTRRAGDLRRQLSALGEDVGTRGRRAVRVSKAKGRKVAPKYRGPGGETWAGRGAMPRWMAAAIKKEGKKREDFLIDKAAAAAGSARKRGALRKRRKK
jgi:DNA-binding protein H-NS